jgi:hypothetical protein
MQATHDRNRYWRGYRADDQPPCPEYDRTRDEDPGRNENGCGRAGHAATVSRDWWCPRRTEQRRGGG